jgi:hypothetical protein
MLYWLICRLRAATTDKGRIVKQISIYDLVQENFADDIPLLDFLRHGSSSGCSGGLIGISAVVVQVSALKRLWKTSFSASRLRVAETRPMWSKSTSAEPPPNLGTLY